MSKWHTFRDDDISVTTNIQKLEAAHEIIVGANRVHTVVVQMREIAANEEVWCWLHEAENLNVQLHGWDHAALDGEPWYHNRTGQLHRGLSLGEITFELQQCCEYWENISRRGGYKWKPLEVLYPPWNRTSDLTNQAAKACGLRVDAQYGPSSGTFLFHYWSAREVERLRKAVRE